MNKRQAIRKQALMPGGTPKYVRCYDNGGTEADGTIDRYTVVFSGKYRGNGWFIHLGMSGAPFHPQGVCLHGEHPTQIDAPKGWPPAVGRKCHLGTRIRFEDLPDDCRKAVLDDYKDIWGLGDKEAA